MLQNIFNATLNTIFVSIPEEIVWVVFVLILLKRRDLLDIYRWKYNIKQIMIPVIPVAISINLMRYILHINNLVNFIVIEIMMCCLMIYLIKKNNFLEEKINYIKIVLYVLLADLFINLLTECIYVLIILVIFNIDVQQIMDNVWLNILLSIVPRIIQISIIAFYIYKKNINSKISFIENIIQDKALSISLTIFTIVSLTFTSWIITYILQQHLFNNYLLLFRVMLCIGIVLVPLVLTITYLIPIIHLINKNEQLKQSNDNMLDNIL